jgi:hypothetical protein
MLLFRLENFHRIRDTNGWPNLLDLIGENAMNETRKEAAKKAWVTRRMQKAKASQAAKKAWVTRRAKACS